jgi:hypothetical protein
LRVRAAFAPVGSIDKDGMYYDARGPTAKWWQRWLRQP